MNKWINEIIHNTINQFLNCLFYFLKSLIVFLNAGIAVTL
jgi:hypothetical protein